MSKRCTICIKVTEVIRLLFSELYSAYYNAVARIIEAAFDGANEKELRQCVEREAFSESILTILPALKSGRWHLLTPDLEPIPRHKPTMPPTSLELRWLKAISDDPRLKLFGVSFPELDSVEPLFTPDDYKIYDRFSDGDPYDDDEYIRRFRIILSAIKSARRVKISLTNRRGKRMRFEFVPTRLEYSEKDDKFRVIASGCKYSCFNLARIESCEYARDRSADSEYARDKSADSEYARDRSADSEYARDKSVDGEIAQVKSVDSNYARNKSADGGIARCSSGNILPRDMREKELVLSINDERNSLERVMLHFAHFEKRAERAVDGRYILRLRYRESDETELVIRVLSFGPCVKVLEPTGFVGLIRERLNKQMSCEW
mgnify:CR=1 FL=1